MADIATIGFKADSSDLVSAAKNLEALGPAADKATGASAKFNAMLDAVSKASVGLTTASASLTKASDQLTAALARGSTATTNNKTATDGLQASTARVTSTLTTTATAANTATKATDDLTRAAKDNTTATQTQAAAQDQLAAAVARRPTTIIDGNAPIAQGTRSASGAIGKAQIASDAAALAASTASTTKTIETETVKAEGLFARFRKAGLSAYDGVRDAAMAVGGRVGLFGAGGAATIEKEAVAVAKVGSAAHASSFQMLEIGRIAKDLATGNYAMLERSGFTLAASFKVVQNAMLPLLATAAVVFGGLKVAQLEYNTSVEQNSLSKYASDLGLTEKEMRKLKDTTVDASGTLKEHNELQITMGDVFKGTIATLVQSFNAAAGTEVFAKLQSGASDTFAQLSVGFKTFATNVIAITTVVRNTLADVSEYLHAKLMATFGDMIGVIATAIEGVLNTITHGLNNFGAAVNNLVGKELFGKLRDVKFDKVKDAADYTNQAASAAKRLGNEWGNARKEAEKATAGIGSSLGRNIDNAARTRIKGLADAIKSSRTPRTPRASGAPSTSLDPFDSIVNGADNDISKTQAAIAGVNLTADAKARLANEQKLLNEADSKGLSLTAAQRAQLIALADKLSDLQVQLKNLEGFKAITDGADRSLATLKAEHDGIGLVGQAAAQYKYETQLLNEALAKNITLTSEQLAVIKQKATALAQQETENTRDKYYTDAQTKATADLQVLTNQLITGRTELTTAQQLLNDAVARHIVLTDEQKVSLIASGNAIDAAKVKIANTKIAVDLARDTTKGFVSDLRSSLSQGEGFFSSFANAAVNALNKILDKMLDLAIDGLFDKSGGSQGGGLSGLLSGLGGLLGGGKSGGGVDPFTFAGNGAGIQFAKGGTFTNKVFNQRTPFSFARGTALGEMGEAGPEAIMPLTRGPDGSLGVAAHGGGGSGAPSVTIVQGDNHYTIAGAIDQGTISAQIRQTAEQTKLETKKALAGYLNEYQQNGAIAS